MIKIIASIMMLLSISMNVDAGHKKHHKKTSNSKTHSVKMHKEKTTKLVASDIDCLTTAIYIESRGQPDKGKLAVAHVIHNRAKDSTDSICKLLSERGQFQGFSISRVLELKRKDSDDWKSCRQIALASASSFDPTKGAIRFQHKSIAPPKKYMITAKIGDHVFLKEKDPKKS